MLGSKRKLAKALRQDKAKGVKVPKIILRKKYLEMCILAIQHNESEVLRELLEKNKGFYLGPCDSSNEGHREYARNLIKDANFSSDPVPLLSVLYEANKTTELGKLTDNDFLNENTPLGFIQSMLEENPSLLNLCVINLGLRSPDKLKSILALAAGVPELQSILDNALVRVAGTGDIEQAKILLEHKADPNYVSCQALAHAGQRGQREIVDLLLPLVNLDLYGSYITELFVQKGAPDDIVSSIKTATENISNKTVTETSAALEPQKDGFQRLNDVTLAEVLTLPDGSTLTTLFNFSTRQQILMKDNSQPAAVSFDDIAKSAIVSMRRKFDALAAPAPAELAAPVETADKFKHLRNFKKQ